VPIVRGCAITCSIEGLGRVENQVAGKSRAKDDGNRRVLCARAQELVDEFTVAEERENAHRTLKSDTRGTQEGTIAYKTRSI
jgi:hypothetical protein